MSLFDKILGREENLENFVRNPVLSEEIPLDDEDIITIDPDKPLPPVKSRPPVIFENGGK